MALCPEQEDARRRVKELTEGRGADVVIEVSANSPEPVADALHHVASGGRIVLAGVKGFKAVPEFLSDLFVVKEAHMLGAFGVTSPNYAAAIRHRIGSRAARRDANPRLRAGGRPARDSDARRRGCGRGQHPLCLLPSA